MRAFTSLAGHVLGSHPEIDGYYEMHQSYEDAAALERQRVRFLKHDTFKPGSRYLFDKLLHDDYRLAPERLGIESLKLLICVRMPAPTLGSIVELFARRVEPELYATPEGATAYYVSRLETLARFAEQAAGRYCYFDAELWQRAPERLLERLGGWLGLTTPLAATYQVFSQTGRVGAGDSSARIRSGRIDPTPHDYAHVSIPGPLARAAEEAYHRHRARLVEKAADVLTL